MDTYEVYALKYADHPNRPAANNFIGHDEHDGTMPIDYIVWLIKQGSKHWIVDTGFSQQAGESRGRRFLACPGDTLQAMGVDPASITDVIITHMHYDHCGNHHLFGGARFHLQDREIAYATGRCMCFKPMREAYDEEDVVAMVRRVHRGKAVFHDGDEEIAPSLSVHRIGGHTMGLQSLRIHTRKGWLVLASDAAHLYANMEQSRPFPIVYNVADMLEGHQRLYRLASSPDLVIPGHDPLVMQRYPSPSAELEGRVVRLD